MNPVIPDEGDRVTRADGKINFMPNFGSNLTNIVPKLGRVVVMRAPKTTKSFSYPARDERIIVMTSEYKRAKIGISKSFKVNDTDPIQRGRLTGVVPGNKSNFVTIDITRK